MPVRSPLGLDSGRGGNRSTPRPRRSSREHRCLPVSENGWCKVAGKLGGLVRSLTPTVALVTLPAVAQSELAIGPIHEVI